jgi:hypothetical protein
MGKGRQWAKDSNGQRTTTTMGKGRRRSMGKDDDVNGQGRRHQWAKEGKGKDGNGQRTAMGKGRRRQWAKDDDGQWARTTTSMGKDNDFNGQRKARGKGRQWAKDSNGQRTATGTAARKAAISVKIDCKERQIIRREEDNKHGNGGKASMATTATSIPLLPLSLSKTTL